jgi:hypothetical protein
MAEFDDEDETEEVDDECDCEESLNARMKLIATCSVWLIRISLIGAAIYAELNGKHEAAGSLTTAAVLTFIFL